MISVIGLGNAATRLVEHFRTTNNYRVYQLASDIEKPTILQYVLGKYTAVEDYENNIPDLKKFFSDVDDHIQFFIVGSSYSSNYALGILEQLKDKKIDVLYVQPDAELMTGIPKVLDKLVFSILQEYARSGLFNSFTVFSNLMIEQSIGDLPIKKYYELINKSIFSTVHYYNYFRNAEPEIGMLSKPLEINRIRTFGILNPKNLQEKWLFFLDNPRDICYYICINKNKLENEGGLHREIVNILKEKPRNAFRRISYAIYETEFETDFGFCIAHTNAIQNYS
tara:strand:+ start:589 stop:1431 length:843 start_codon:yes stop_codon:yes gene_type:complete